MKNIFLLPIVMLIEYQTKGVSSSLFGVHNSTFPLEQLLSAQSPSQIEQGLIIFFYNYGSCCTFTCVKV
jgi:hypothetical protein